MKIEGPNRPAGASQTSKSKRAGRADTAVPTGQFQKELEAATEVGAAEPAAPVAPVDALLALQEVGDAAHGRSKGLYMRGQQMLEGLREIQLGLLDGRMPRERLLGIREMIQEKRAEEEDPELHAVLDEIELRVEVELAKLLR